MPLTGMLSKQKNAENRPNGISAFFYFDALSSKLKDR